MEKKYKGTFRRDKKPKENTEINQEPEQLDESDMRLNRFLSHSGVASRRKSDEIIKEGRVKVNGEVVKEMGYRVQPTDEVVFDGKVLKTVKKFIYLLMNKPHNVISTLEDERDRRTVLDLVKEYTKERVYPVGRLDRNTTGLLMLTNDGELAQKLAHPKFEVIKIYQATLDKPLEEEHLELIKNTLVLEDGPAPVDDISFIEGKRMNVVGIQIHIGRNRIVRRIFEHLGYEVKKLDRSRYAMLTKKNLPVGKCRQLTESEVNVLKYMMKDPDKKTEAPIVKETKKKTGPYSEKKPRGGIEVGQGKELKKKIESAYSKKPWEKTETGEAKEYKKKSNSKPWEKTETGEVKEYKKKSNSKPWEKAETGSVKEYKKKTESVNSKKPWEKAETGSVKEFKKKTSSKEPWEKTETGTVKEYKKKTVPVDLKKSKDKIEPVQVKEPRKYNKTKKDTGDK
jgi:23S rRNA pseudouridine2605 synthase